MPNFITQSVSLPPLPARFGEVEFLETARGRNLTLVRTKSFDSEFFITLKPSGDKVIVKGEKITKPAKIGHLQRALEIFKERFCGRIISQAFAYKDSSLTEKTPLILDENEILSLVKSSKFNKIFIEIGFGSGRHLLHQARSNQDALLIGIEIYKPAIEQVAKLAIREDLQNIALIATDARVLLSLLPAGCLQRVFLHFPVPWDDAPHRRVISDEFASQIARTLGSGGRFELRTDSEEYFLYAMQKLSPYVQRKAGEISHFKNRNAAVASKYEDRWRKMDKDIYDLIYENKTAGVDEPQQFEMEFLKFDAAAIARNFKNFTFKGEDFFVHFEEIFYFDAQKSLDAGGAYAERGVNLSGADEAINDEAINLDATCGGNLTERGSMDEISTDCGKISATTAGDKISACANATQILKKTSAVPCKNEPQAELKNELNRAAESQAELQNKSNSIKSQIGHRSELSHDELQAEHQGKLNRAERQDKRQSEPSYTEQQNEWQSMPCTAEPQDVLILLSLGTFDFPQQCFIRANASGTRYFIRRPLPTRENHAAHQKISEIFSQWQR
ncbi:tRNA (guanosine(46)-N7)-methyltransferase TrmB [uncultured Campylobacter sp.]|uniref:tRNA (guanosine(46)-N7)-methyltransferase TrmB n=1 Tax=uncultured Campylobacter sp. TaxID=218934 RepID=UPI00262CE072|nr:tRNA (guanosine(46)-N7)-methyltransferase TrmB [uncultured Campylobacter sp.]